MTATPKDERHLGCVKDLGLCLGLHGCPTEKHHRLLLAQLHGDTAIVATRIHMWGAVHEAARWQ